MESDNRQGILLAVLAAALYALSSPFAKLLLPYMPSTLMAGFLYLGAGLGMAVIALWRKLSGRTGREKRLTRAELPYTAAMILLDIAAPICLLLGLSMTTAANASLLNNFEIAATALIALLIFKERISPRLWLGITAVTLSCLILSFEDLSSLHFSGGSLCVLLAACCWGLENNCTRKISSRDPLQIVLLKGLFSGGGSLIIGLAAGERIGPFGAFPASCCWALPPTVSVSTPMFTPSAFSAPPGMLQINFLAINPCSACRRISASAFFPQAANSFSRKFMDGISMP